MRDLHISFAWIPVKETSLSISKSCLPIVKLSRIVFDRLSFSTILFLIIGLGDLSLVSSVGGRFFDSCWEGCDVWSSVFVWCFYFKGGRYLVGFFSISLDSLSILWRGELSAWFPISCVWEFAGRLFD